MKIGIVGSNSNLGRNFANYFLKNSSDIVELYDIHENSFDNHQFYKKISFNDGLINNIDFNCDVLFVFFGLIGTVKGFTDYEKFINVNEIYLIKFLDYLVKNNSKSKIIYVSSRLVYSDLPKLHQETDKLEGNSIYAINKIASENIIKVYSKCFNLNYTIFRVGIPFGSLDDNLMNFGVASMLEKQAKGGKITLFWSGKGTRTFTHISDICYTFLFAVRNKETDCQIFNVGGCNHSLYEVAQYYSNKYNAKIEFVESNKMDRDVECFNGAFNFSKIESVMPHKYIDLVGL